MGLREEAEDLGLGLREEARGLDLGLIKEAGGLEPRSEGGGWGLREEKLGFLV